MFDGFKPPKGVDAAYREVQRAHKAREEREKKNMLLNEKSTELLEEINTKLGGLDEIIRLLVQSTTHQKEILELLNEVFSIGTAPDQETALSRYEKVEGKINKLAEVYESAKSLIGVAKYIYTMTVG